MDEKFSMCGKGKMQTVSLMLVAARKTLSNFILDWVVFISFSLIIVT
jgi:hypothetical protein